jgi:hypothetical protein
MGEGKKTFLKACEQIAHKKYDDPLNRKQFSPIIKDNIIKLLKGIESVARVNQNCCSILQ